jgi:hypothetical protein
MSRARLPLALGLTLAAGVALAQAPPPAPPTLPGPDAAAGAPALALEHTPPACVLAGQFVRLEAVAKPADRVQGGRVYFRAEGEPHWYYVEAERTGGAIAATLPKPDKATKGVRYYVEVSDTAFHVARTPEHTPVVVAAAGACGGKAVAKTVPTASIELRVPPAAPPVPPGFLADGVKQ